jgi:hypothetical protein
MKLILFLTTALLLVLNVDAQPPQGFTYQAVVRNASGEALANQSVSFLLKLNAASKGETYYSEKHTVTTTPQGVANLVVGEGTPVIGSFALVPWASEAIELQVEVDPSGGTSYQPMGVVNLKSVPYALFAPPTGAIASDPDAPDDDPIFIVRNKEGKVVFAVYQTGVRMYVEDDATKSSRGGFAIGGLADQQKESTEYFRVTPDSVRVYLREPATKSSRGGFAIGGLADQQKTSSTDLFYIGRDSARIYVDTDNTKSSRGGFAIGGLADQQKAQGSKLMYIGQDSARIYIDTDNTKSSRGGFAIGGLADQQKGISQNFFNVTTDASGIINPSQPRILWYPLKNAFLTGQVIIQHPDSVGTNSMSTGYESKAKGGWSQALGYKAIARGNYSTAIGKNALAQTENSFAFGDEAKAIGFNTYAFGTSAKASGTGSFAFGSLGRDSATLAIGRIALASGDYSFAIGLGAQATNTSSFAMGQSATASGVFGLALGNYSTASGRQASALGANSRAEGNYSTAISSGLAQGYSSTAIGYLTKTIGSNAISIGSGYVYSVSGSSYNVYSTASGSGSVALGNGNNANGSYSMAMGYRNYVYGDQAIALGSSLTARAYNSLVVGAYNIDNAGYSTFSWTLTDPLFVIGNGTYGTPSNAITVLKNGRVGIGNITAPNSRVHINSSTSEDALRVQVSGSTKLYVNSGGGVSIGSTTAAPANGLYVSGNVGFGVANPTNKFEVNGNAKLTRLGAGSTISVPEYNVEAYGTNAAVISHYSGQSRGGIAALSSGRIAMLSTNSGDNLLFGYSPDIAQANFSTSFIERMRIVNSNGFVGIGVTAPTHILHINGQGRATNSAWATTSDIRLKDVKGSYNYGLNEILKLKAVRFNYKKGNALNLPSDKEFVGIIAQELKEVIPEAVSMNNDGFYTVNTDPIFWSMLNAIKEQQKEIEVLKEKNKEIENLKAELEAIKKLLQAK